MKALSLAAGRGERMRPLTNHMPKPLLPVGGKPLVVHLLERLHGNGITEVVINHSHLGNMIEATLGDGKRYGIKIRYSAEDGKPLETGGGIYKALPLLGEEPFLTVNGDLWTDYQFRDLPSTPVGLAHLVLIDNPEHHPQGDFGLDGGKISMEVTPRLTFSGIGVYRRELFANCRPGAFRLAPLLKEHANKNQVTGEHFHGNWLDVGTPERLEQLSATVVRQAYNS